MLDPADNDEAAMLMNMWTTLTDCLYRNLYRYRYVVVSDIDEMIVPRMNDNYSQMVDAIEAWRAYKAQRESIPPAHSYEFRNAYFFFEFGPTQPEPWYSRALRYQQRLQPSRHRYSVKSITRILSCLSMHSHVCEHHATADSNEWRFDVDPELGLSQHYKRCHFNGYLGDGGACATCIHPLKEQHLDIAMERFREKAMKTISRKLIVLGLAEKVQN